MYYIRHYIVFPPYDASLHRTLEETYSIRVNVICHPNQEKSLVFDVPENHPGINELERILPPTDTVCDLNYTDKVSKYVAIIYFARYSQTELLSAKWLSIRNTTCKIYPENGLSVNTCSCCITRSIIGQPVGRHVTQAEPYVIKSPIKWGRFSFVSAYCHEERLFCNTKARAVLEARGLTGIEFIPVLKKSTGMPIDDVFQLGAKYTIPDLAIAPIYNMKEFICEDCGMHMLQRSPGKSSFGLRDTLLDPNVDFWQTEPMFLGSPKLPAYGARRGTIISQRMYRALVETKLDRGFVFSPLELVT